MDKGNSSNRYALVESMYQRVVELPSDRRAAYLAEQCEGDDGLRREVEALIEHYEMAGDGFLAQPVHRLRFRVDTEGLPEQIGRYRIIRKVGQGGMGVIYEARQQHPARTVALKIISAHWPSGDLLRRFRHECQVLARLQHPGIAQLFDADVADVKWPSGISPGTHYFAMEFIDGRPLDVYARDTGLGVRQRLELMAELCDSVAYAHQKGVIHRDLKPANVLVTSDGQPKVLDFGVARLIDGDVQMTTMITEAAQLVGTLAYMSPEQVAGPSGQLDTRTDVYSLGVILYKLLTDQYPYDLSGCSMAAAARIISEEPPAPLTSMARAARGDLEPIVRKALAKDPDQRYPSVIELSDDIRRHLRNEPVEARRGQTWYVARKMFARHWLAGSVAALFLVIVTASAITLAAMNSKQELLLKKIGAERDSARLARESETLAREDAERSAATSDRIVRFLQSTFAMANPQDERYGFTVAELLDRATADLAGGYLSDEPEARLAIRRTLGRTYEALGRFPEAESHLEASLEMATRVHGAESREACLAMHALGRVRFAQNRLEESESLYRRAIEIARSPDVNDRAEELLVLMNLATLLASRGACAEAESISRQVLEASVDAFEDRVVWGAVLHDFSISLEKCGQLAEAEDLARRSLQVLRETLGDDHPRVTLAMSKLAGSHKVAGRHAEADQLFQEVLARQRRVFGESHREIATTLNNIGTVRVGQQRFADAASYFEEALAMRRELVGDKHPDTARSLESLGIAWQQMGELAHAEDVFREALAIRTGAFGSSHPLVATSTRNLATVLADQGDFQSADTLMRQAIAIREELGTADDPNWARDLNSHGLMLKRHGELASAERAYREALAIRRRTLPAGHFELALSLNNLGELLRAQRRFDEAAPLLVEAFAIRRSRLPEGNFNFAGTAYSLGATQNGRGHHAEAEDALRDALQVVTEVRGQDSPSAAKVLIELGIALAGQRKWDEAACYLNDTFAICLAMPESQQPRMRPEWQRVAAFYRDMGRVADADAWELRAESLAAMADR